MTKDEFRELLQRALQEAARTAEARLERRVPHRFEIELHAPGVSGDLVNLDQALDRLYLGPDRFYRIIDTAIRQVLPEKSIAFVRVSGHPPVAFDQTWDPAQLGPFKQILADSIEQQPTRAV